MYVIYHAKHTVEWAYSLDCETAFNTPAPPFDSNAWSLDAPNACQWFVPGTIQD